MHRTFSSITKLWERVMKPYVVLYSYQKLVYLGTPLGRLITGSIHQLYDRFCCMLLNYKKNNVPINTIPIEDVKISALGRNRKASVTYDQLRRMEFCLKGSTTKRKKKGEFIQSYDHENFVLK